jgi:hypothetical protein
MSIIQKCIFGPKAFDWTLDPIFFFFKGKKKDFWEGYGSFS